MEEQNVIITDIGLSKIAGATAGIPLILEQFAVGDATINEIEQEIILDPAITSLVSEKYRDFINTKYSNNNNLVIECVLRANAPIEEGFYLRELGIFDIDGNLIAYVNLPKSYRPSALEGTVATENIFNIDLKIENSSSITISVNESIFATQEEVDRAHERIDNLHAQDIASSDLANIPDTNTIQKALDALMNMQASVLRMFIGVEMTHFNDGNPLAPNQYIKWMWLEAQLLLVSEYPDLYSVIGNRWGGTSGVNFYLPDTRNRIIRAIGSNMGWGYQEDAIQNITGQIYSDRGVFYSSSGAFRGLDQSTQGVWTGMDYNYKYRRRAHFDASRVVRTSSETRVKSLSGRKWMITKILI